MDLVEIQKSIILDELDKAVKEMLDLTRAPENSRLQNQVIQQSGRYHGNENRKNNGTLSEDQYTRTRNQIRIALQGLLEKFHGYSPDIQIKAQAAISGPVKEGPPPEPLPVDNSTIKILILSANPTATAALKLNEEYALISKNRDRSPNSNRFPIVSYQAVTLPEFTKYLYAERPAIVHFSGHGEIDNEITREFVRRGLGLEETESLPSDNTGIILTEINKRDPHFVSTTVIRQIFSTMIKKRNIPIQAVIFNSCYSEAQAEAIADLVPHVIGTSWSVSDQAAIAFANGFYSFFTETEDVEAAWDDGIIQAMAYGESKDKFVYFKNGEKMEMD